MPRDALPPASRPAHWKSVHAALRRHALTSTETGASLSVIAVELEDPHRQDPDTLRRILHDLTQTGPADGEWFCYRENRFLCLLPQTSLADASDQCQTLRELLSHAQDTFAMASSERVVSIGCAEYVPDEPLSHFLQRLFDKLVESRGEATPVAERG